jgi:hypothetical protein
LNEIKSSSQQFSLNESPCFSVFSSQQLLTLLVGLQECVAGTKKLYSVPSTLQKCSNTCIPADPTKSETAKNKMIMERNLFTLQK